MAAFCCEKAGKLKLRISIHSALPVIGFISSIAKKFWIFAQIAQTHTVSTVLGARLIKRNEVKARIMARAL